MNINIDVELIELLKRIKAENKSDQQWAQIESSDMFQSDSYCGGYDADENAFCFSYYDDNKEYWFQFGLAEIDKAISGEIKKFVGILVK